ncbi:MAG TPA: ribosome maturation factor RimP [Candidatus Eremiobacteraceae bacterium]|jgi:ribosome maturation factor RimP
MTETSDDRERIETVVDTAVADFAGVELVRRLVVRERGGYSVRVMLDREGGVSTQLCETVSKTIARGIDALSSPAPDYDLEVASAGLDRPLLSPAHFRRFAGRKAKVVTSKPVGNRVEFSGPIVTADDVAVVIDDAHAGATPVPHAVIKRANLIYDASTDFKRK